MLELNKIHNMNCLEGLKLLDDNSVDSIVTDPPYELGFMGKKWDNTGIAYNVELWKECLRVLKPGGYLLSFGGSRTYHRMACAIEDAGFEIRDQIMWIYGSGFPKSMDISKAIDKKLGVERTEVIGQNQCGTYKSLSRIRKEQGYRENLTNAVNTFDITSPASPEAKQWEGFGTALKPAHEPIVVARKPLSEKTVAENVLKWNTGGINIDGCRIEHNEPIKTTQRNGRETANVMTEESCGFDNTKNNRASADPKGRFPANIIFDEEAGILLDEQSGITKSGGTRPDGKNNSERSWKNTSKEIISNNYIPPSEGGASRFFYCAKSSKKERGEGNNHPTVKPISLMRYLVKLITPPNGVVLDPFVGSGTTCLACINENFQYIGFELDTTYCDIANKRIQDIVV